MKNKQLSDAIIKTLCYFDVFEYPLQSRQIFEFLTSNSITHTDVENELKLMMSENRIFHLEGYYALSHRDAVTVRERKRREDRAMRLRLKAQRMVSVIRRFPFVRGIMLTGDLSKNVAVPQSDIDYLIITEARRVWICRALMTIFKKIFLLNQNKYFCFNFLLSESALRIRTENVYTALETVTVRCLYNFDLYKDFKSENDWVKEILPNVVWEPWFEPEEKFSKVQKGLEFLLNLLPLDRIDDLLMRWFMKLWRKRYPDFSEEEIQELFQCTREISTRYTKDHQTRILNRYEDNLRRYNLS